MTIFMYTVPGSWIWLLANSLDVHHLGPSLYKAACRLNLEWFGWRRVSGPGGGGGGGKNLLHMIPHRLG
jgi:hypothetical protein